MRVPRLADFREIWLVDFEFCSKPGNLVDPVCLVALEVRSGKLFKIWKDALRERGAPYSIGEDALFVAYFASAELSCHLMLGWELPVNIVDLYVEFRNSTNGARSNKGSGLLAALSHFRLGSIYTAQKDQMRELILTGGPWTDQEQSDILDYCYSDVDALMSLLQKMEPNLDVPRALVRGRYMKTVAIMEHNGIPIAADEYKILLAKWTEIQDALIKRIDKNYGVFEGRTFKSKSWKNFVESQNIPWPITNNGNLKLDDQTFRDMSRSYPIVAPIKELRSTLSLMKSSGLTVGSDSRNRCLISPFASKTGRNQPSTTKFIFGNPSWIRGLIKPEIGTGVAYIDWCQQEFGIAAALSKDGPMMEAYESGDPYLALGKQAGAIPQDATKESHPLEREKFKSCILAVQYGMGAKSLADRIGCSEIEAKELLALHKLTYRRFWEWSDKVVDHAQLNRRLWTVFNWTIHYPNEINVRSVRNFPMQANGAEMLRLACCFISEKGVRICAPIHDAILIEFDLDNELRDIQIAQEAMLEASKLVLSGFKLRTDVKVVRYPDRWTDDKGKNMWDLVWEICNGLKE